MTEMMELAKILKYIIFEQTFHQRKYTNDRKRKKKRHEKMLNIIRETQLETTIRYHYPSTTMAKIKD